MWAAFFCQSYSFHIFCYDLSKVSKHVTYTFDLFVYFLWHYNNFTRFTSVTLNNIIQKNFPEEYAERKSEHDSLINFGVDLLPLFVMDVVIPCQKFPLHIFEPRYRLMVSCDLVLINLGFHMFYLTKSRKLFMEHLSWIAKCSDTKHLLEVAREESSAVSMDHILLGFNTSTYHF